MKSSKVFKGRLSEVICIYIFVDIQYLNIHERIEFVYLCLHNVVWLNTKANILCCQCINKLKIIEQFRRGIQRHFNFAFVIEDGHNNRRLRSHYFYKSRPELGLPFIRVFCFKKCFTSPLFDGHYHTPFE